MNIVWLDQAERDLDAALDYIIPRNPAAALRLYQDIRECALHLADNPRIGRQGRVDGTREIVIYPYVMAYTVSVQMDAVIILRVLHGARVWPDEIGT